MARAASCAASSSSCARLIGSTSAAGSTPASIADCSRRSRRSASATALAAAAPRALSWLLASAESKRRTVPSRCSGPNRLPIHSLMGPTTALSARYTFFGCVASAGAPGTMLRAAHR